MNLKPLRKAAGMTQQQLANNSGIHRVTIARIESGTAKPGSDTLQALSAALGCTIDELMLGRNATADPLHNSSIA